MEIKGGQFGVRLEPREDGDNHVCVQIISEDDGNWSESGEYFSSFWLNDLIDVLIKARRLMEKKCKKQKVGFGYEFKAHRKVVVIQEKTVK